MRLTERQESVLIRIEKSMTTQQIADDLGISRNAVYQTINRLKKLGEVPADYTPSGMRSRAASARQARNLNQGSTSWSAEDLVALASFADAMKDIVAVQQEMTDTINTIHDTLLHVYEYALDTDDRVRAVLDHLEATSSEKTSVT